MLSAINKIINDKPTVVSPLPFSLLSASFIISAAQKIRRRKDRTAVSSVRSQPIAPLDSPLVSYLLLGIACLFSRAIPQSSGVSLPFPSLLLMVGREGERKTLTACLNFPT